MRPLMEHSAHWFLDRHVVDGQMDFVRDYASPVPPILTMRLMGLPDDNWQLYANVFHSLMAVPQNSDEYANAIGAIPRMMQGVVHPTATLHSGWDRIDASIGSHLARLMSEVMVKAVLDRIPDYQVDIDGVHEYLGNPSMTGLGKLPVTFASRAGQGTPPPW